MHTIHQPEPVLIGPEEAAGVDAVEGSLPRRAGDRMAASYINFYIANGGVVAPQFDDLHDDAALATLRRLFRDRKVVGVPTREILLGGGNIHCITQQQPSAPDYPATAGTLIARRRLSNTMTFPPAAHNHS